MPKTINSEREKAKIGPQRVVNFMSEDAKKILLRILLEAIRERDIIQGLLESFSKEFFLRDLTA